jgi:hypothetical protein
MSTGASAQAWIGQVAGEMAAEQQAVQVEFNCRHGTPVDKEAAKASLARTEKALDAYFALSAASPAKDIQSVFVEDDLDVSWQDGDQKVAIDQLAPHLSQPLQDRKLIIAVTGYDNRTTRTIWSGHDANGPVFYAIDFTNGTWLYSARIKHLAITHGATPPETPPAYCHLPMNYRGE